MVYRYAAENQLQWSVLVLCFTRFIPAALLDQMWPVSKGQICLLLRNKNDINGEQQLPQTSRQQFINGKGWGLCLWHFGLNWIEEMILIFSGNSDLPIVCIPSILIVSPFFIFFIVETVTQQTFSQASNYNVSEGSTKHISSILNFISPIYTSVLWIFPRRFLRLFNGS